MLHDWNETVVTNLFWKMSFQNDVEAGFISIHVLYYCSYSILYFILSVAFKLFFSSCCILLKKRTYWFVLTLSPLAGEAGFI